MSKEEKRKEIEAKIAELIEFCKTHNFTAELVGCWVWVTFDAKPDEATRKTLKDAGFKWSPKRKKWAHNCGRPTRSGKGNPWDKYENQYMRRGIADSHASSVYWNAVCPREYGSDSLFFGP